MCGICGVIGRDPLALDLRERVVRMNEGLHHRGPDGAGEFTNSHVALAMRRLSIIDLTGGWQPLYNEDRTLVLIANGEIYNYIEARAQLQARGHHFATGSDCETILHLYEEYGLDCVRHLRGMFAFALWDARRRQLLLARDRMGEKPLYLYEKEGSLWFASELKALVGAGVVPFELDPVAVHLYFHYQYVPEPRTPLRGVRKLDAAHWLLVETQPWRITEGCYWRMEDAPPLEGDPASLIRQELETVSELVIRSDVPVGVALSGGVDSGAIAVLAARKYPGTMQAFSVGYPGRPAYDERKDAQALADHVGMPFHEVELTTTDMVALFPELVYWRDDPIADISGYGYYAVMKLAREHQVPVMLQGQGGDELFWGYPWVRQAVAESQQKADIWRRGWRALPDYLHFEGPKHGGPRTLWQWIRRGGGAQAGWEHFRRLQTTPTGRLVFYDQVADYRQAVVEAPQLYTAGFAAQLNGYDPADLFIIAQPWSSVETCLTRLICDTYLRENGITQGDRLSMASSIELRLPLLDYKLVETVIGLRKTYPDAALPPKTWFKAAVQDILPAWVMQRPKRGFEPPVQEWYAALFQAYGAQLTDGYLVSAGILKPASARRLGKGLFPTGVVTSLSFKSLVLELWCRQMVGHKTSSENAMWAL